jgi:hypothetical protein
MKRRIPLAVLAIGLVVMSAPREALAWSRDGHRIVCRIAYQLLDSQRRAEVDRLTSAYRDPAGQPVSGYFDACAWADEVRAKVNTSPLWQRFAVFETWHFANLPRTTTRLTTPPCEVMCVINAIPAHIDSMRRAPNEISKAEALFFLGHWVGDLHQPLHIGYLDDRGGNSVRPIEGGFYSTSNLHATWDGGIPGKMFASADWQEFADRLAADITPEQRTQWSQGAPTDWAQESYDIVTSQQFQYCEWQVVGGARTCQARPGSRTLNESYQEEFAPVVARRLQQAGTRLADILRTHLTLPS